MKRIILALAALRLAHRLPEVGESRQNCSQAGRDFEVQLSVLATPNPDFRQVRAQVQPVAAEAPVLLNLSTVIGRS